MVSQQAAGFQQAAGPIGLPDVTTKLLALLVFTVQLLKNVLVILSFQDFCKNENQTPSKYPLPL